jgi:spore maturation protein SpmA
MGGAICFAAFTGRMQEVTSASFDSAKAAVTIAIGLVGIMALWLGLVRVLEAGGLMFSIARLLKPLMSRLFPEVPATHPAMGAMILNISANMLGLGNAATPFGIKAMVELEKLNPLKGTATNAMCLFLAINTSSVAILPLGVIGVRAAAGASDPAAIWIPTFIATILSTIVGISVAFALATLDKKYQNEVSEARPDQELVENASAEDQAQEDQQSQYSDLILQTGTSGPVIGWLLRIVAICLATYVVTPLEWFSTLPEVIRTSSGRTLLSLYFVALLSYIVGSFLLAKVFPKANALNRELGWIFIFLFWVGFIKTAYVPYTTSSEAWWLFLKQEALSHWLMPYLMLLIVFYGLCRGVKMYEAVTDGAKQGFDIAVRIIPFLVAILVAVGMFRASGAMDQLEILLSPYTELIGMTAETLPMAMLRPLSGTGAFAIMSEIIGQNPDSYSAFLASTMMGSTETTFYVLAVYFGAVGVLRLRHALIAAICADIVGMLAACWAASVFYTPVM